MTHKPPPPPWVDDIIDPSDDGPTELPERRLLIAMIHRALVDYIYPEHGKAHLQYDAGSWLFADARRDPFSLYWVCEILSPDPDYLHRRIQQSARTKTYRPKCVIMRVDPK